MSGPESQSSRRRTLVVGPAGSGKTLALMDRIRPWLHGGREDRAMLLLPTYGQVQHVRRLFLLAFPERRAILESPIVTFTSLAERVVGHPIRRVLSGAEKDLVLKRILDAPGGGFGDVSRYPGFRSVCLEVLKEIKENGVETAEVAGILRSRAEAGRLHLDALADVLERYQAALSSRELLDHEDLLVALNDRLADAPEMFRDLEILAVDGFTDFTRVERAILGKLAIRADRTFVSLTGRGDEAGGARFESTSGAVESFRERGYAVEILPETPRFRRPELAALERNLFRPDAPPVEDEGAVEILVGADIEDETDRIARRVARLIRVEGYRPHQIGVVVRSFEGYRDLLPEAFARHGVPLLLHAGRPLTGEAVARDTLGVLAVVTRGWVGSDVRALLLGGGLADPDAVDALLRGLPRLPEGRDAWLAAAEPHPAVAEALAGIAAEDDALRGLEEPSALADRVRGWWGGLIHLLPIEGDPAAAATESDAIRTLGSVLDGVVRGLGAVGDDRPGLGLFAASVRSAAERAEVRSRSRRFETVHAISVTDARQWELRAVVVAGLLEGIFPRRPREDVFLRDRDRVELNRDGRLLLKERLRTSDEERYFFHVATTRARDLLVLTRPATDGNGSPLLPSFFLRDVSRVFSEDSLEAHTSVSARADGVVPAEEVTGTFDLRRRALIGLGEPWVPGDESPTERQVLRASLLHDRLRDELDDETTRRDVRIGLRFIDTPEASLPGEDVAEVARRRRTFSPSGLAAFAACPYADFAGSTLRLASPENDRLERMDVGRVAHETLRAVLGDGADLDEAFDAAVAAILPHLDAGIGGHRDLVEIREHVRALARSERDRLAAAGAVPLLLETRFGFGGDEVLFGTTPVRGVIDRVDVDGQGRAAVLDYKLKTYGAMTKVLEEIAGGKELQLPIYVAAARHLTGKDVAAAFLLPVEPGKTKGVAREEALASGLAPPKVVAADADTLEEALDASAAVVAGLAERIRSGEISVEPETLARCGRGGCPYFDLCRVEPWVLEAERAEAAHE